MVAIIKKTPRSERNRIAHLIRKEQRKIEHLASMRSKFIRGEMSLFDRDGKQIKKQGTYSADLDLGVQLSPAKKELRKQKHLENLTPLLPLLFNLNGRPYKLTDHFPFEPFYHTRLCRNMVWKTGRQVAKSTNQASSGVLTSNLIPYFNTLFVTPLFEMIRRFSSNYVRPFIDLSPIKGLLIDSSCNNSVFQRSFRNQSTLYFSFAFLDADRTRGLNCAKVAYDEVQDLDPSFIPIIRETMSASDWGLSQFTGTPKTLENTLEVLWMDSSQAEWCVRCDACNHWNIATIGEDLDGMLGPTFVDREISERHPAVVCSKCQRPINPRSGFWLHARPELRFDFSGYHVPQLIMPMHYNNSEKWSIMQGKRQGFGNTSQPVFYNEVCGESFDTGAKLLTVTDLRKAACLHENTIEEAVKHIGDYTQRIVAVDWGGGGADETSFTAVAVLGWLPDGKIDVIYGWRSLTPNNPVLEAQLVLDIMKRFLATHMVHDFAGAGAIRETIITQAGLPENRSIPVAYARVTVGPMIKYVPLNENTGKRSHHVVDKTRSLQFTCELIKHKHIRFFAFDYKNPDNKGLLYDFLALIEDRVDSRMGQELCTIIRNKKAGPDDFAHAVNIGVCSLCHANEHWPDIALMTQTEVHPDVLHKIDTLGETFFEGYT